MNNMELQGRAKYKKLIQKYRLILITFSLFIVVYSNNNKGVWFLT